MEPTPRQVRSFVRRSSRLTSGQRQAIETLWSRYGVEADSSPLDMARLFGRTAPTVLEIGFGMGASLIEMAHSDKGTNYLGIEVYAPGIGNTLKQIEQHQLTNVRVLDGDAVDILSQRIADHCLAGVNIFFPDPWHKTRHHKRRLIQPGFVRLVHQKLMDGGQLHLATDWENYAHWMMNIVSDSGLFNNTAGDHYFTERPAFRPVTKFEKRALRLEHSIWDLIFTAIKT